MKAAMRKVMLYALMVTTTLLALAAVLFGALILLMTDVGDVAVIPPDFPYWLFVSVVIAVPALLVFLTVKVWRYCLRRLPFSLPG